MNRKVVIGSRESALAVVQSKMVINYLEKQHPEVEISLKTMKTTGDKILDRRLDEIGGKGLFVKELDRALYERETDYSVHSLKDLPMELPEELPLVCCSAREDARDALVLPVGKEEIDFSKPIGTSSKRRILQLKELYPQAEFQSVRGNLQTRLKKLDSGEYSALILAAAGLKRMGLADRISRYYDVDEVIPAAGQGILAIQGRMGDDHSIFDGFANEKAMASAIAERMFVKTLDGGCTSPIASHARITGNKMTITGFYYDEDRDFSIIRTITGRYTEAAELGRILANCILNELK